MSRVKYINKFTISGYEFNTIFRNSMNLLKSNDKDKM